MSQQTPATVSPIAGCISLADFRYGISPFPRRKSAAGSPAEICEINTTPLIDVLLVLLVTLIITLPTMTQAVKLDLKYDAVAKVLAAAQRNRLNKLGFVNSAEFAY